MNALRAVTLTVVVLSGLASCKHAYNETDFSIALAKHHSNLRWGRVENAALLVDPQMRAAFVAEWLGRQQTIELQEVEVAGISRSEDGDTADVMLRIVFVDKDSMSVREVVVSEKWQRTSDGWLAVIPASLELRPPPSATPPEAAPPTEAPAEPFAGG